jgi:FMN phosphatase YigB (HAD superfamily)
VTFSFDVFDTVLVRTWWNPEDIFRATAIELTRQGAWIGSERDWCRLRREAEREARAACRFDEVTLDEIYAQVQARTGWTSQQAQFAKDAELRHERTCLRGVGAAREAIDAGPCIFVTDTYLSRSFVAEQLATHYPGVQPSCHPIFCSSELRKTKHKGSLFPAVATTLGCAPSRIHHTGDNRHSDVRMARRAGLRASWWTHTRATPAERRLGGHHPSPDLVRSALAGAARAVRLEPALSEPHLRRIWELGANIAGPLIVAFCAWVLQESQRLGLERIFFFARDGQILARVAERISLAAHADIQARYLYASRQAYYFPAITDLSRDPFARRWLLTNIRGKTPRQLSARLNLTPEEITSLDPSCAAHLSSPDESLSAPEDFVRSLIASPPVAARVNSAAARAREVLLDYLRQEGVLDAHVLVGVVDVGWHGRLQASLQRVIDAQGGPIARPLQGFYLGLRDRPAHAPPTHYLSFADAHAFADSVVEAFTMADHGSVIAIERAADGLCHPRLQEAHNEEAIAWGLATLQAAIMRYADTVCSTLPGQALLSPASIRVMRETVLPVVTDFCSAPPPALARALGALRFADDQLHCVHVPLAPTITPTHVAQALFQRRYDGPGRLWVPGALSASITSDWPRRLALAAYALREGAMRQLRLLLGQQR